MNNKKAFTLIETLIAVTLTTVVITAVTGLILATLLANQRNLHTLQALYYAEEGVEAVRFMRDSNWLQNYSWNGGGSLWGGDFSSLESGTKEFYLGVYGTCAYRTPCFYLSGSFDDSVITSKSGTEFSRKVLFSKMSDEKIGSLDAVQVDVTVAWEEHGIDQDLVLTTYLTNWQ